MNILMLKPSDKIIKAKNKKQWVTASAIISFILVLIGAATLVLIQKPIKESQDLRQQASVDSGSVQMSFSPTSNSTLAINQEAQVNYQVTTNGVQVDGLQLVFNVVSDTLGFAPEFILTDTANLQIAYQQAEQVSDGYLLSFILIGDQIASPVFYASPTTVGYLRFTPQNTGTIEINFDVENSVSTVFNSTPPQDQLTHISTLNYTVVDPTQPSASPSPSPTSTTTVSPSPTATSTVTPSPTPTADPGTGTGGTAAASCNESCSSNNDCEANHRCYNNQCRLVTNISSSTCAAPSTTDAGLNRACNEYCADNRECGSGYSCYFNRCRNPLNLDSTSCAAPSQQVATAMIASCNQGCATHKDCAANLLCHSASGSCRLATNPSSTSCTPASNNSVSTIYATKGATNGSGTTPGQSASPAASSRPTTTPSVTQNGQPSTNTDGELPIKDETALSALFGYVQDQLAARNISLPLFFIILGLVLLLIVVLISVLARLLGRSNHQPPIITPVGRDRDKNKDTKYENKLAERINSLQENQQKSSTTTQTQTGQTGVSVPKPLPTSVTTTAPAPTTTPSPLSPPPQAATTQPQPGNSMMDRLKNKEVATPLNQIQQNPRDTNTTN
jgi:hypothetical protein